MVCVTCATTFPCSYAVEVVMKEEDLDAQIQSQFVMQQLCLMLAVFDLSDEMGRLGILHTVGFLCLRCLHEISTRVGP